MPILPMGGLLNQKVIRQAYAFTLEANRAKQIARIENVPARLIPFFSADGIPRRSERRRNTFTKRTPSSNSRGIVTRASGLLTTF